MENPPSVLRKRPEITQRLETMRQLPTEINTDSFWAKCLQTLCVMMILSSSTEIIGKNIYSPHLKWDSPLNYILNEESESNLQERFLSLCALGAIKVCAQMLSWKIDFLLGTATLRKQNTIKQCWKVASMWPQFINGGFTIEGGRGKMTSENKLPPDDTMEAYSGCETKQNIFGQVFLRGGKKCWYISINSLVQVMN